jgi:hypothetical protein
MNRIHRILQQLAHKHPRPAVQIIRQQRDDPLEVDLKAMFHDQLQDACSTVTNREV